MFFKEFLNFFNLSASSINLLMVILSLNLNIDYSSFTVALLLMTSFISLFYNYLSIEIDTYRVSFV
jgi:hypothetical protein